MAHYPNWFANYADRFFDLHLTPLAGQPGLQFLQIGAFTGDASVWMLERILTGPYSSLTDVDTWQGSGEPDHEAFDFADVERVYDKRTDEFVNDGRLVKFKGSSMSFFNAPDPSLPPIIFTTNHRVTWEQAEAIKATFAASVKNRTPLILGEGIKITRPPATTPYDFIYIDGDHTAVGVLNDAVNAYQVLKVGGLIAFDDYLWKSGHGRLHDPGPAIDAFADIYADRLEQLDGPAMTGLSPLQRWFRKTA